VPEAVIVATARTPIGRAFKRSLKDLRPDDLAAFIIRTALEKVPQLDPEDIDDLMLGCGLPGGEQGFNMARVVAVLLGYGWIVALQNDPLFARWFAHAYAGVDHD
jgi:acetyl-CoA C-acetyltransferase